MPSPELQVLFPTNFSAGCVQAGHAITQLSEGCLLRLTLVHVMKSGTKVRRAARALDGFLAEVDEYCVNDRLLLEGDDPASTVADLCRQQSFDLVMAPRSCRSGLPSLFTPSFRARLLQQCGIPLWTAGDRVAQARFGRPLRTVACLVDFTDSPVGLVRLAAAFADRFGARLRVLSVVPSIDDSTIADVLTPDLPLVPEHAVSRIQKIFDGRTLPDIDVAVGSQASGLRRLMQRADADLLFVGSRHASSGVWFNGFSRVLDHLPCPVVCADGAATRLPGWAWRPRPLRAVRPVTNGSVAVAGYT